jgi:Raf kinase inhibitor-like YbhB/YbcL family protein
MAGLIGRLLKTRRAGHDKLSWNRPDLQAPETIRLKSTSFDHGAHMPVWTAGKGVGGNRSPQLQWSGVPAETKELVLIIEDPDVPLKRPIVHLSLAGIPQDTSTIPEGALNTGTGSFGTGKGSFDRQGYAGPRPVPGHGPHAYVFQLYALGEAIALDAGAKPEAITNAMAGKVIARGRLDGYYER